MEEIAILTGGDSAEYNISLLSAKTVLRHLNKKKYNCTIVHLKNGEYKINNAQVNKFDFSYIDGKKKKKFDKIFIALHGSPAENGLIQDYFDKIKVPYTSCNAKISDLTFDKFKCNSKLRKLGFRCPESILLNKVEVISDGEVVKEIGLPCFVKPNGSGSSFGVSKVTKKSFLLEAIKKAFKYDNKVIIERFISGKEVSCGVYFNGDEIIALPITEIITENNFFDYKAKYEGQSKEITPAKISKNITLEVQKKTVDIYKKMNLKGICRIDFIINENNPYIIEINTIPGLTQDSIIPKQLKVANIRLSEIFEICLSNIN